MKRRAIVASVFVSLGCLLGISALISQSSGQSAQVGIATAPPAQTSTAHEVWVALRTDGQAGSGSATDPFDATGVEKFNPLFERLAKEYGVNLTIHIGPGVFYGDRLIRPLSNWKFRGAGRDITILCTRADANAIETIGIRGGNATLHGVEVSDMTFDFNTQNLRKANRVFAYLVDSKPLVYYYYAQSLPAWSNDLSYERGFESAVVHMGMEYISVAPSQGKEPVQGELWSVLQPCDPAKLPAWEEGKAYAIGDAVAVDGKAYICVAANTMSSPSTDANNWRNIQTDAPDPRIYTTAVFVHGDAPYGNHRVYRAKAINGYGSSFFGREAFLFGLGGNDCAIEDCQVADFQGDYGSLIVVMGGQNNVVRNCSVRGNGGLVTMAYGGWAVHDTTFENNYCNNVSVANNIDSLTSRNVTYRGNTFMECHSAGILINVSGKKITNPEKYQLNVNGTIINTAASKLDGLFIYDNVIQVTNDCLYGGIQVQADGLSNVKIANNVIRTLDGKGNSRRAIGVHGKVANVQITGNTCDPDMYCEIAPAAFGWGNVDLQGQPIKGLEKLTEPVRR
jgi:hypothetical protein